MTTASEHSDNSAHIDKRDIWVIIGTVCGCFGEDASAIFYIMKLHLHCKVRTISSCKCKVCRCLMCMCTRLRKKVHESPSMARRRDYMVDDRSKSDHN